MKGFGNNDKSIEKLKEKKVNTNTLQKDKLISKSSIVDSNSKIINSVIGENVTVKNSVIMSFYF